MATEAEVKSREVRLTADWKFKIGLRKRLRESLKKYDGSVFEMIGALTALASQISVLSEGWTSQAGGEVYIDLADFLTEARVDKDLTLPTIVGILNIMALDINRLGFTVATS